ncbi:Abi family protein [Microbacterium testaceum]|uniref:Abi family protein n=1 Tax=Microbacterium testaceum TaxID=2033 RepID=UPI001D17AFA8|nr:Abi family protein [Microbacterium testaceum]MCC4247483.1 Abi family protein [Microbacterium testaceum]
MTPRQRVEYLVRRGYIEDETLSGEAESFLAQTNFHYFLGYARNFRKLRREGLIDGDDRIDRVIKMVEIDHEVSTRLFTALRTLEWRLRATLVDRHCDLYEPRACFLHSEHYRVMNPKARPIHQVVREQILRSREPFVRGTFEAFELAHGRVWQDSPENMDKADQLAAMETLPIWAAVDGWTLGALERIITETAPVHDGTTDRWLWKEVASAFGVANALFHTQLTSVIVTRNLVAHHSRLWMRPTASSPKRPKIYRNVSSDAEPKSMYVAWLALAAFLRPAGGDKHLLADLDALLSRDPLYERGVKRPLLSAAVA